MGKKLSEMSLEELWELFPIYLTEHQDCWSEWYEEEQNILKNILPTRLGLQIYHIGSTAIHGIWAKPIVDILIELPDAAALVMAKELLVKNDYISFHVHSFRSCPVFFPPVLKSWFCSMTVPLSFVLLNLCIC